MCTIFYVPSLLLWNEYPYEKKEPKASRFATHCDSYEPQLPRGQRRQFERRAFETQKCRQPNLFYCFHPSQFLGLTANCFYFIFRVFFFFQIIDVITFPVKIQTIQKPTRLEYQQPCLLCAGTILEMGNAEMVKQRASLSVGFMNIPKDRDRQ